jgi:hypothetical protein
MKGEIIRTSGVREPFEGSRDELAAALGCDTFDTVNLRDGTFMYLDDVGHPKGLPVNPEATKLYHKVCIPGTTHPIAGDVAVIQSLG